MKFNNYNPTHDGYLPVRVLQHNIINEFEKVVCVFTNASASAIANEGLNKSINYIANKDAQNGHKVAPPCVYVKSKTIQIQETFLAYLWGISYCLYTFANEIISREGNVCPEKNNEINRVFKYSCSLINKYSEWDKTIIPNPEEYEEEFRGDIEKVNEIFLMAFNFILCHEFSHVECGHCNTNGDISDEQKKEFEINADKRAIELLTTGQNTPSVSYGISVAIISQVFFGAKLNQKIHPDVDVRIFNAFTQLELNDNDQSWLIACIGMALWSDKYSMDLFWCEGKSFKDLFEMITKSLD
ncbi:TPA: phage exclusion protein Lit family protein [Escherichia coli]